MAGEEEIERGNIRGCVPLSWVLKERQNLKGRWEWERKEHWSRQREGVKREEQQKRIQRNSVCLCQKEAQVQGTQHTQSRRDMESI